MSRGRIIPDNSRRLRAAVLPEDVAVARSGTDRRIPLAGSGSRRRRPARQGAGSPAGLHRGQVFGQPTLHAVRLRPMSDQPADSQAELRALESRSGTDARRDASPEQAPDRALLRLLPEQQLVASLSIVLRQVASQSPVADAQRCRCRHRREPMTSLTIQARFAACFVI